MANRNDFLIRQTDGIAEWTSLYTHPTVVSLSADIMYKNTVSVPASGVVLDGDPVFMDDSGYVIPIAGEDNTFSTETSGTSGAISCLGAMAYSLSADRFLVEYTTEPADRVGNLQTIKISDDIVEYGAVHEWYTDSSLYNGRNLEYIEEIDRFVHEWSYIAHRYVQLVSVSTSGASPSTDTISSGNHRYVYESYGSRDTLYDPISDKILFIMGKTDQGRIKLCSHSDVTLTDVDEEQFILTEATYIQAAINKNTGKFVILYNTGSSTTDSQFGYVDTDTLVFTNVNTETALGSNYMFGIYHCEVNDILVLIYGADNSDPPLCRVGTVDWENESITWGAETSVTSTYDMQYVANKERLHYDANTGLYNLFFHNGTGMVLVSGHYDRANGTVEWIDEQVIYSTASIDSWAYDSTNNVYLTQNYNSTDDQAYVNVLDVNGLQTGTFLGVAEEDILDYTKLTLLVRSNGSTFEDLSLYDRTIANDGVTYDTDEYNFNSSSMRFTRAGLDHFDVTPFTDLNHGANDFIQDCWVKPANAELHHYISGTSNADGFDYNNRSLDMLLHNTGFFKVNIWHGATLDDRIIIESTISWSTDYWNFMRMSRTNDIFYMTMFNGTETEQVSASAAGITLNAATGATAWGIGYWGELWINSMDGWIDEFRVMSGVGTDSAVIPTENTKLTGRVGVIGHKVTNQSGLTIPSKYYLDINGNIRSYGATEIGKSLTDTDLIITR